MSLTVTTLIRSPEKTRSGGSLGTVFWFMYVALLPIYLLPSGGLQVADLFLLLTILHLTTSSHLSARTAPRLLPGERGVVFTLGLFVIYALLVNSSWATLTADNRFIVASLWYIYSFIVFVVALLAHAAYGARFIRATLYAATASVIAITLTSVGIAQDVYRVTGLYNNPNQLGYYAVLVATLFYFRDRHLATQDWRTERTGPLRILRVVIEILAWLSVLFLGIVSSSRAAIYSLMALGVLAFLRRPIRAVVVVFIFFLFLAVTDVGQARMTALERRLEIFGGGRSSTQLEEEWDVRGYGAVVENWQFGILGGGEGDYERYGLPRSIHSTYGTLLLGYGIIGFGIFAWFIVRMEFKVRFPLVVTLTPTLLYGMTHHGIRFRMFWVLLAILLAAGLSSNSRAPRLGMLRGQHQQSGSGGRLASRYLDSLD